VRRGGAVGPVVGSDKVPAAQLACPAPVPTLVLALSLLRQTPKCILVLTLSSNYSRRCVGGIDGSSWCCKTRHGCALAHARMVPECNYHDRRHSRLRIFAMLVTFSRRVLP
jgi:hypothetical protein